MDVPWERRAAAREIGLRWVDPSGPCIRRRRRGKGFEYVDARGRRVTDPETLERIRALVIPPAWESVWICPDASGHIQATGRDARGRKQYRYHARFRARREQHKFDRMRAFGEVLPRIRARVEKDLRRKGLPLAKVQAVVVSLLDRTLIRVGNEEYRRDNGSFGLTTLLDRHARFRGAEVRLRFVGKSGKTRETGVEDPRLARIVKRCRDLPGQVLFQYEADDGTPRAIGSADVNEYLRSIARRDVTSKDFRTWGATVLAALALHDQGPFRSRRGAARRVKDAIEVVAAQLGNTPTVCRRSYVHPAVLEAYEAGSLLRRLDARRTRVAGLSRVEAAVLALLRDGTGRSGRQTGAGDRAA